MSADRITWTDDELAEFDRLIDKQSSRDQVRRIEARMYEMPRFIELHGRPKCEAMWEHLEGKRGRKV